MRAYFYVLISFFLFLPAFRPIEESLERRLIRGGEGMDKARVRITASRLGFLFFGYCRHVTVELHGLSVGGLKIDSFLIEVRGLRFRPFSTFVRGTAKVRGAKSTNWRIRVIEADLQEFFNKKSLLLGSIKVSVDPERIRLHRPAGIASLFALSETFTLRGRLVVSARNNVCLELGNVSAFGFAPARGIVDTFTSVINPIIRASDINNLMTRNRIEALENLTPHTFLEEIDLGDGRVDVMGYVKLVPCEPEKKKDSN